MKAIKANKKRKSSPKKTKEPKVKKVVAEQEQPWDPAPLNYYRFNQPVEKEPMTLWQKIKDYFWV